MRHKKFLILTVLILLYILFRIIVILGSEKLIIQGEEFFVGMVAQGIIEGWAWPLWDFQVQPHFGSSILVSLIVAPMFMFFGPYVISLKSASTIFYLAGLILFFLFIVKHFGLKCAIIACLLYIFSPPLLTARTLIFNGSHTETAVFNILIIVTFFNLMSSAPSKIKYIYFGVLCGFCFWLSYSTIIMISSCIVSWLMKEKRRFFNRKLGFFIISFIIGLTPFFLFNFRNNFYGLDFLKTCINNAKLINCDSFFSNIFALIFKYGFKVFSFDEFSYAFGNFFNVSYYVFFWASYIFLSYSAIRGRGKTGFKYYTIIIFPVIYAIFYGLGPYHFENTGYGIIDYRYALGIFPVIFLIIALQIDHLFSSRIIYIKICGLFLLLLLLAVSSFGNGKLFYPVRLNNRSLYSKAYNYEILGYIAFRKYALDMKKAEILFSKIKKYVNLRESYRGYGKAIVGNMGGINNLKEYMSAAYTIYDEMLREDFLSGIGFGIIESFGNRHDVAFIKNNLDQLNRSNISESYKDFIYAGILERLLLSELAYLPIKDVIKIIPDKYRIEAYIYYGVNSCRRRLPADCSCACDNMDNSYKKYCYMGMGGGIASFFSGDKQKIIPSFKRIGLEYLEPLLQGVGLYYYKLNNFDRAAFENNFPIEWLEFKDSLLKGINSIEQQ